jgi:cadmium resistance protein CadD (predicted permease)
MTLALGGDNLAVWIPLLRADGFFHAFVTVAVFAVMEFIFLVTARGITSHPRVIAWGTKHVPSFLPWLYFGLGVLILIECGSL